MVSLFTGPSSTSSVNVSTGSMVSIVKVGIGNVIPAIVRSQSLYGPSARALRFVVLSPNTAVTKSHHAQDHQ